MTYVINIVDTNGESQLINLNFNEDITKGELNQLIHSPKPNYDI